MQMRRMGGLSNQPNTEVRIIGHTDSTGSDSYNLALSQRRATSVADYLTTRGVQSARLGTRGFGEGAPLPAYNGETQAGTLAVLGPALAEPVAIVNESFAREIGGRAIGRRIRSGSRERAGAGSARSTCARRSAATSVKAARPYATKARRHEDFYCIGNSAFPYFPISFIYSRSGNGK